MNRIYEANSRRRIVDQCRAIRRQWSEIERHQRRIIAAEQQRRLAEMLFGKEAKEASHATA